ncbi:MAG: hypothetical protein JJ975_02770 [Bacteroidia bacterium]|nr:hypothetical protein [Bacteroidia bacterium]
MKVSDYHIIQNVGIGAVVLHKFVKSYHAAQHKLKGPNLALSIPVLPIVYNQRFLEAICNRNKEGGFYNALSDFRDLPAGLQERMESMSDQTFEALNLTFANKMLTYNKELNELLPIDRARKPKVVNDDIKKMIRGADRLGYWFSSLSFEQLCIYLKISF